MNTCKNCEVKEITLQAMAKSRQRLLAGIAASQCTCLACFQPGTKHNFTCIKSLLDEEAARI